MKYLRVVTNQIGDDGKYGILKDGIIHFLSNSPISERAKETGKVLPMYPTHTFY